MPWLVVRGRDLQNVFSDLNSVNTDRMGGRGGGLLWIHSIGGDWFPFSHRTLTVEKTNPPPHTPQIKCRVQEDPIDVIVCSLWSCMFCCTKSTEMLARPVVSPSSDTLFKLFTAFWILSLPLGASGGYFHLLFPSLVILVQCKGCALRVMRKVVSKSMLKRLPLLNWSL